MPAIVIQIIREDSFCRLLVVIGIVAPDPAVVSRNQGVMLEFHHLIALFHRAIKRDILPASDHKVQPLDRSVWAISVQPVPKYYGSDVQICRLRSIVGGLKILHSRLFCEEKPRKLIQKI